ncbi:MAG: hypothetical protein KZQ89_08080 [Candidatus Thiodiazotropha sp. (ex Lucinoma kastoroae)]|nr:hypothetical protein [Candidatus Thiodiazotropha sp. (ex Lucinoma kastoroae)]
MHPSSSIFPGEISGDYIRPVPISLLLFIIAGEQDPPASSSLAADKYESTGIFPTAKPLAYIVKSKTEAIPNHRPIRMPDVGGNIQRIAEHMILEKMPDNISIVSTTPKGDRKEVIIRVGK